MTAFTLPALGENVAKAIVARVLVHVGETVAVGQGVVELETEIGRAHV